MNQASDFPNAIEMEKQLLSAMFLKEGKVVPAVSNILVSDDLYRVEHRLIFQAIMRLYAKGEPTDFLSVEEELRKVGDWNKIDHRYLLSLIDATYTTALAESHAKTIKEKANLRRLILTSKILHQDAANATLSTTDIIAKTQLQLEQINHDYLPSNKSSFSDFFANHFDSEIEQMKNYADRRSGFYKGSCPGGNTYPAFSDNGEPGLGKFHCPPD